MKLIKITDDHYVVVDDSEIKEGDFDYSINYKTITFVDKERVDYITLPTVKGLYKKITHSTQPLNCNCSNRGYKLDTNCAERNHCFSKVQYLPVQEVKELIGEVDVEKKAEEYADFSNDYVPLTFGYKFNTNTKRDYLAGYNQALEDNKEKKYTEEDMINAFREGTNAGALHERLCDYDNGDYEDAEQYSEQYEESFIKSLQLKTEWEVEVVDGKLKLK